MKNAVKIYIGNLPTEVDNDHIFKLLLGGDLIPIKVEFAKDKITNTPLGYGFVSFGNLEDAERAVQILENRRIKDNYLKVSLHPPSTLYDP